MPDQKKRRVIYYIEDIELAIDSYLAAYHEANLPALMEILKRYIDMTGPAPLLMGGAAIHHALKWQEHFNAICELKIRLLGSGGGGGVKKKKIEFDCSANEMLKLFSIREIDFNLFVINGTMQKTINIIRNDLANNGKLFYSHSHYRHRMQWNVVFLGLVLSVMFFSMLRAIVGGQRYTLFNMLSLLVDLVLNVSVCAYLHNMNERKNFGEDLVKLEKIMSDINHHIKDNAGKGTIKSPSRLLKDKETSLGSSKMHLFGRQKKREEAQRALRKSHNVRAPMCW